MPLNPSGDWHLSLPLDYVLLEVRELDTLFITDLQTSKGSDPQNAFCK